MRRLALGVLTLLALTVAGTQLAACGGSEETSYANTFGASNGDALYDEEFSLGTSGEIVADLGSMDLDVRTTRSRGARVRVEGNGSNAAERFENARFEATLDGDRLRVRTRPRSTRGWSRGGSLTVVIEVPEDVSVNTEIGSGDVRLGTIRGAVAIDTGSGDVDAGNVGGAAEVETGSGDVVLGAVRGGVDVSTGSGSVEAEIASPAPVSVETGSGEVDLTLEKGLGFAVSVATGSGDIDLDDALSFDGSVRNREATGRIGAGGSPMRISTGSGDVTVRSK